MKGQHLILHSLKRECQHCFIDAPQDANDEDFRSRYLYASAALILVGVGLALPGVAVGILGAIGFGAGGVVAGQYFPHCFTRISLLTLSPRYKKFCGFSTVGDLWGVRLEACFPSFSLSAQPWLHLHSSRRLQDSERPQLGPGSVLAPPTPERILRLKKILRLKNPKMV